MLKALGIFSISLLVACSAFAVADVAQTFTLDGRLYSDAAATTALTDGDVNVVVQILNADQTCVLYEETQAHFNALASNGYFTFQIGSVVSSLKRSALDSNNPMASVFSNTVGTISGRTIGGGGCTYTGSAGDKRFVRMLVTPSSDSVTRILSPNMPLDSVPTALVAERAESVQGFTAANLIRVNTTGSQVLSQSNIENIFSSTNYSALTSLLGGSSNLYSKQGTNGTSVLPSLSSPTSPSAGQIWYDGGAIKFYNGSSTQTLGVSGAGISSLSAGTGLNVGAGPGGTITTSGTLNIDVGTTAGKILQVATGNKLPAIDGSQLTNLPAPTSVAGSAISGTIGGSTAINTTGTIAGATGSFGSTSTGQLSLYDHATTNTNYVTIKTPATATLTTDYTLTLPAALPGSGGQVLTSDSSGNLSWSSPSTGSVTSVTSGGAPIVVGGTGTAPTVSVSAATTSASGVVTLAANNGTTASTVVQATDSRLTDSRAPNGAASGDLLGSYPAPTVAKINGKTVTYTTITAGDVLKYDGTDWVNTALSSANLSNNADLLKASNMPANCSAGSTLTFSSPTGTWACTAVSVSGSNFASQSANVVFAGPTSGSATPTFRALTAADLPASASYWTAATGGINYSGGNVGIGNSTPTSKLHVSGGNVAVDGSSSPGINIMTNNNAGGNAAVNLFGGANAANGVVGGHYYINFDSGWTGSTVAASEIRRGTTADSGYLTFMTKPTGSAYSERLRIDQDGNVGIGTTNPVDKLSVAGKIRATHICASDGTNCKDLTTAWSGGSVTSVSSGGAPIVVGGTASAPTVSVNAASTSASGVVTLASNGGTTASTVVQADDSRLSNSRAPSGTASGDLSGSYPGPTVAAINGKAVTYTSLTSGDFLKYNGTGWVNTALSSSNLSNDSNLLKASNMPANCAAGSTLTFSAPTGTWVCSTITGIDGSAITTGTVAPARMGSGTASSSTFLRGDGTWQNVASSVSAAVAPSFLVNRNGTNQTVSASTAATIAFTNVVFDTNNNWASNKYTPTIAGKYYLHLSVYCPDSTAFCAAFIYKNGSPLTQGNGGPANSGLGFATTTILVDMNGTTDYVTAVGYNNAGTTISGGVAYTYFTGGLMAPLVSGGVAGTGTANYLPMWSNSSNLANSPMAVSGSNVGIGTTSPGAPLEIATTTSWAGIQLNASGAGGRKYIVESTESGNLQGGGKFAVYDNTGGGTRLIIDSSGNVGIGTTSPSTALEVNGVATAANLNVDPIMSSQPGTRWSISAAAGTWYPTGETITVTVPAGPNRRYRVVVRQLILTTTGGQAIMALSSTSGTLTSSWQLGGVPHLNLGANVWSTLNTEGTITLAPGTYTYYMFAYTSAAGTLSVANESTSGRAYSNIYFAPM